MKTSVRHRVLVLGGGYAGIVAASRIAGGNSHTDVTLVDTRAALVQRVRMHELLAGSEPPELPFGTTLRRRGVEFEQGLVEGLDLARQWAAVYASDGRALRMYYDTLVLALGSSTAAQLPGVAEHTLRLDNPMLVRAAGARVRSVGVGARIVVVGSGLTGIETASEMAERFPGAVVTMLASNNFGTPFAPAGEQHLRTSLRKLGVIVRSGEVVEAAESQHLHLRGGEVLPFDLCVWAAGFEASPIGREAGLPVASDGRAIADGALRVWGQENVYAAGDAAAVRVGSNLVRMGCVSAGPLGAFAGDSVLRQLRGEVPATFSFGYAFRCISLGRRDGLVQFTDEDDNPKSRVLRHATAATVKEMICRLSFMNVKLEAWRGIRSTFWSRPDRAAAIQGKPLDRSEWHQGIRQESIG